MAISNSWNNDSNVKNQYSEYKNCFETQEGIYKLIYSKELFSRDKETSNVNSGNTNTPVMLSFLNRKRQSDCGEIESFDEAQADIMCVNFGKELFVYPYDNYNINQENSPIDKRLYKCTFPTCHDFNAHPSRSPNILLIVGFTGGQIQLIDPIKKEQCKLFNEERYIDKTAVTCIKWVPTASNQFLVSHASGFIYIYKEDLPCGALAPIYQVFKQGCKYCIYTCKTKSTRNPLYRWELESPEKEANAFEKSLSSSSSLSPAASSLLNSSKYCAINNFAFSATGQWLAVASQDGFLRVFDYHKMELQGCMRSYFGGIICLDWSADEKFIVMGGQDDLVTVWSVQEQVVICRGQGHKSWVSTVKFDPYMCPTAPNQKQLNDDQNKKDFPIEEMHNCPNIYQSTTYRFGSVGQDTLLCLWELTEDVVRQALKFANHQREKNQTDSHRGSKLLRPLSGDEDNATLPTNVISNRVVTPTASTAISSSESSNHTPPGTINSTTSSTIPRIKLKGSILRPSLSSKSNTSPLTLSNTGYSGTSYKVNSNSTSAGHNNFKQVQHQQLNQQISSNSSISQKLVNSIGGMWNNSIANSDKKHPFSFGSVSSSLKSNSKLSDSKQNGINSSDFEKRFLGTLQCPRLEDVPILEPIVSKHVSNDRLSDLVFREDSLLCTCQQGALYAWTRPGYSVIKNMLNADNEDDLSVPLNSHNSVSPNSNQTYFMGSNQRNSSLKINRSLSRDTAGAAI